MLTLTVLSILFITNTLALYIGHKMGSDEMSVISTLIILRLRKNLPMDVTDDEFGAILKKCSEEAKAQYRLR